MKKLLFIICVALFPLICSAQKEGNIWYFGNKAGLDFKTNPPTALTDGKINTSEGCSTVSDPNGNLLFYTDGSTVWNKLHSVMLNGTGLFGNSTSTHSSVVIQKPLSNHLFYIFTTDVFGSGGANKGFCYSVVDMALDAGKGSVVEKNNKLLASSSEKIGAISHANQKDFWVVTLKYGSDTLLLYKVNEIGVDTNPIIHKIGTTIGLGLGQIKFSVDGTLLALTDYGSKIIVLNFDNNTGQLSGRREITGFTRTYGLEIAPSSKYLYVSNWGNTLHQCMILDTTYAITKYCTKINSGSSPSIGQLQLAPDYRIYFSTIGLASIGYLNYPDSLGSKTDIKYNPVNLLTGKCNVGLPTFIQSYFLAKPKINISPTCLGDSSLLSFKFDAAPDSFNIAFGDGKFKTGMQDTGIKIKYRYSDTGTYMVRLTTYHNNISDTSNQVVIISKRNDFFLGPDTNFCPSDSFRISAYLFGSTYLWIDNSTNPAIQVKQVGSYAVKRSYFGCDSYDTLNLGNKVLPLLTLGNDTFFCEGDSVLLNVYDTGCTYLWNNASHDSAIYVSKADTVVVWKTYHGCVKTDSVILIAVPFPSIDIMKDTVFCDHGTIKLISMTNTMQLLWNNGTTDPELPVQQSGTYWCRASTGTCMVADTIHVVVHPYPKLELGMDTILCSGQSLLLDASDSNCVYSWSTGESTSVIQVSTSGMIKEISARDMCQTIDSVNVDFMDPPVLIPLHDTSFCDGNTYILNAHSKNGNLIWNNFSTDTFIAVKTSGNYSVTSSNRCGNSQSTADITFYTCLCNVFIPDIFTPDDDHLNDQFQPVMNCHAISYELQLFNRWGQQLFQTNLPQLGWDGTFQNRPCPTGVYFWVLTTITENQVGSRNIFSHSGTVSLLR